MQFVLKKSSEQEMKKETHMQSRRPLTCVM